MMMMMMMMMMPLVFEQQHCIRQYSNPRVNTNLVPKTNQHVACAEQSADSKPSAVQ
jgi:hypothetical protein